MIVEIKNDIFEGSDFKSLNYLIQILTYQKRYKLLIEITLVESTDFYQKLDILDREDIEANYNNIIKDGKEANYTISEKAHPDFFNIEEAIRYFIQPVSIILENSLNDQYFVRAIVKYFDTEGEIQKHIDNGWLQFENAGGCTNVENFLKGKLQSFNNLPKDNYRYLRCFVLLDSDRNYPTEPLKQSYIGLSSFLEQNEVIFHILAKRCMENYMPDEVFDEITHINLQNWIGAYRYLSPEQRDFLNIDVGFPKTKRDGTDRMLRSELDEGIRNFYSETDISATNFAYLDLGFKYPHFKSTFPKLFETSHNVHKTSLKSRCNSTELEEILQKIISLI